MASMEEQTEDDEVALVPRPPSPAKEAASKWGKLKGLGAAAPADPPVAIDVRSEGSHDLERESSGMSDGRVRWKLALGAAPGEGSTKGFFVPADSVRSAPSETSKGESKSLFKSLLASVRLGGNKESEKSMKPTESGRKNVFTAFFDILKKKDGDDETVVSEDPEEVDRKAEMAKSYFTPAELEEIAMQAFRKKYVDYHPKETMPGRRDNRLGFNIVDMGKMGRIPSAPRRQEYEERRDPAALRAPIRFFPEDEKRRFDLLVAQLTHNNLTGKPMPLFEADSKREFDEKSMRMKYDSHNATITSCFRNITIAPGSGRSVKLAGALSFCHTVRNLNLTGAGLHASGMGDLVQALKEHPSLTRLTLTGNKLGEEGAKSVAEILCSNTTLQHLDISLNGIGDQGCEHVCDAILDNTRSKIMELNVSTNKLGAYGGYYLSRLIRDHHQLHALVAWRNGLGTSPAVLSQPGFDFICEVLPEATHLRHIDVSFNNIKDGSVKKLVDLMREDEPESPSHRTASHLSPSRLPSRSRSLGGRSYKTHDKDDKHEEDDELLMAEAAKTERDRYLELVTRQNILMVKELPRHMVIEPGNDVTKPWLRELSDYFELGKYSAEERSKQRSRYAKMVRDTTRGKLRVPKKYDSGRPDNNVYTYEYELKRGIKEGAGRAELDEIEALKKAEERRLRDEAERQYQEEEMGRAMASESFVSSSAITKMTRPESAAASMISKSFVASLASSRPQTQSGAPSLRRALSAVKHPKMLKHDLDTLRDDLGSLTYEIHDIRETIRVLSEMGSPSDEDLQRLEHEKQLYTERKSLLSQLLRKLPPGQKVSTWSEAGDDFTEDVLKLFVHLCLEGDQNPASVEAVDALLRFVDADFPSLIESEGLVALQCGDGNRHFLKLLLQFEGSRYDSVDVVSAACFSQSARIPLMHIVIDHIQLTTDEMEELHEVICEFIRDIASEKKKKPREDRTGRLELIRKLLRHPQIKYNWDETNEAGATIFSQCCFEGDVDLFEVLKEEAPLGTLDPCKELPDETTPFLQAIMGKNVPMISELLKLPGCDPNHPTKLGKPLTIAKNLNLRDMVHVLLKAGATE